MGSLKPGATYIYERDGSAIYAREFGADPSTRRVVGYESDDHQISASTKRLLSELNEIVKMCEDISTHVNCDIVGFDILQDLKTGEYYVMEINISPHFSTFCVVLIFMCFDF